MNTFDEFWLHYLREHSQPATRTLHAAGTLAGTACLVTLAACGKWRWLPVAFVPGYAAAWAGHFFVERNRPATFEHPLWSFAADYKMVAFMLAGKLDEELERAGVAHQKSV